VALAFLAVVASFSIARSGFARNGAVVLEPTPLRESPGGREELDLEPGRLVEARPASGAWIAIGLGGGLRGWIPTTAIARVENR